MSAAELIEQIKALSPAEQEEVRSFLLNGESEVNYIDREKARATGVRVMEENADLFRKLAQ